MSSQPVPPPVPSDTRHILFRYHRRGTEIVIGASLAWLIGIVVIAIVKPEVFAIPAGLTALWKYWRGS